MKQTWAGIAGAFLVNNTPSQPTVWTQAYAQAHMSSAKPGPDQQNHSAKS